MGEEEEVDEAEKSEKEGSEAVVAVERDADMTCEPRGRGGQQK